MWVFAGLLAAIRQAREEGFAMRVDRPVSLTAEGKEDLERELQLLRTAKLPAVTGRIQELTQDGDVSDNSEYEDTKEELIIIEARIREIENLLRHAQVIPKSAPSDRVQLGSRVTLVDEHGERDAWTLVSREEANTLHGKISDESPVGKAVLNKRVGDKVVVEAPAGETTFTIEKVE
jgi:transcription elongation factor GreA